MSKDAAPTIKYKGYLSPNYTPVPDELFDEQLPDLSGAELKVLLYIIRRTFGFKKDSDNISLNQLLNGITTKEGTVLDRGTGLSKKTLLETIRSLVKKNLIITERRRSEERGDEPTTYRLNILDQRNKEPGGSPRGVKSIPGGVEKSTPGARSKNYTTQETVLQQTDLQYRNSKIKRSTSRLDDNKEHHNFLKIGNLLKQKEGDKLVERKNIPQQVKIAIKEISTEFGERRNTQSNLTHAVNLLEASGKHFDSLPAYLYEARSITKQQENVKKRMPYFFGVLADILDVKNRSIVQNLRI